MAIRDRQAEKKWQRPGLTVPSGRRRRILDGVGERKSRERRWLVVVSAGAALVLHGLVGSLLLSGWNTRSLLVQSAGADGGGAHSANEPARMDTTVVVLVDDELGPLLTPRMGPADRVDLSSEHPLPSAVADRPGRKPSAAGAGEGGPEVVTGRRDRDDLRAQIWNGPAGYRVPRSATGDRRSSAEAIARDPERGFEHRRGERVRARHGAERALAGKAEGRRSGRAIEESGARSPWADGDPLFDSPPRAQARRRRGHTQPGAARPLLSPGDAATEAEERGPLHEHTEASAASDERNPSAMEFSTVQGGGIENGTAGLGGDGALGRSRRARGDAASREALRRGPGGESLRASRQDPYFRRMYERIDRIVEFPRDLALALEQGEVVVFFALGADGSISTPKVIKSSGFRGFDVAILTAIERAQPFGKVPKSVLGTASKIAVTAPFRFSNPLIR